MNWMEIISNMILPAIGLLATVIAAGTAIWGICAWRQEYRGKRQIDLAEEVLALVYEARDVLEAVRSPLEREAEGSTRPTAPDEIDKEKAMLNQAYIQIERCNSRQDLFARLRSLRYRFMAQHGEDPAKPFEELNAIRRKLSKPFYKLHVRLGALRRKRDGTDPSEYDKELDKLWQEWQTACSLDEINAEGEDPILKEVDAVVEKFERICRKTIGLRV